MEEVVGMEEEVRMEEQVAMEEKVGKLRQPRRVRLFFAPIETHHASISGLVG